MLIGLDAGTSVVKAVAFGNEGEALRVASRPLRTEVPAPGRAEQDLEAVIAAVPAGDQLAGHVVQHPALARLHAGLVHTVAQHIVVVAHHRPLPSVYHGALVAFDV